MDDKESECFILSVFILRIISWVFKQWILSKTDVFFSGNFNNWIEIENTKLSRIIIENFKGTTNFEGTGDFVCISFEYCLFYWRFHFWFCHVEFFWVALDHKEII